MRETNLLAGNSWVSSPSLKILSTMMLSGQRSHSFSWVFLNSQYVYWAPFSHECRFLNGIQLPLLQDVSRLHFTACCDPLLTEMIFPPSELLRHFEWDKIEQSKAVSNMCFLLSIKQPITAGRPSPLECAERAVAQRKEGRAFRKDFQRSQNADVSHRPKMLFPSSCQVVLSFDPAEGLLWEHHGSAVSSVKISAIKGIQIQGLRGHPRPEQS